MGKFLNELMNKPIRLQPPEYKASRRRSLLTLSICEELNPFGMANNKLVFLGNETIKQINE